jgi:hypothetical protein
MFCSESKTDFDCNSGKVPLVGKKSFIKNSNIECKEKFSL